MNLMRMRALTMAFAVLAISSMPVTAQQAASVWPRLRHIDPSAKLPENLPQKSLRLLVANDFAPFSFKDVSGQWVGISIELAQAACVELKFTCEVVEKPFGGLVAALQSQEGDVVVTGHRLSKDLSSKVDTTKPYYLAGGRFLMRAGTPLESADVRTLAGKRLGFVAATTHGQFIDTYYKASELQPLKTEAELFEALRTGTVDVIFLDALRAAYWLKGTLSRSCCVALGATHIDRGGFSKGLSLLLPKGRQDLRTAFDYALDQLEKSGKTAEIFTRHMPPGLW